MCVQAATVAQRVLQEHGGDLSLADLLAELSSYGFNYDDVLHGVRLLVDNETVQVYSDDCGDRRVTLR